MAASAIAVLDTDPELATLLALEAIAATPEGVEQPLEVINALWQAGSANRLVDVFETGHESNISLSPDGTRLAVTTAAAEIQVLDAATGELLWSYTEETVDFFAVPAYSPDGRVALSVIDSTAQAVPQFVEEQDELPNRMLVLEGETGELVRVLEFPSCDGVDLAAWSPDAAYLAVGSGRDGCLRDGVPFWLEVYDTATWEPVAFLAIDSFDFGPVPRFDDSGRLYALLPWSEIAAFEAETFEPVATSGVTGIGDVTPDGSQLVLSNSLEENGTDFSARTFDTGSGEVIDILYTGVSFPSAPIGIMVSSDGRYAIVGTNGATTSVFDIATGVEEFRLPTGEIFSLGYDPGTERLYTAGAKGDVRVWDLGASAVGVDATGDLGNFTWVNGNSFAIGPELGTLESIDTATGEWAVRFFDPVTGTMGADSIPDAFGPQALANGKFVIGVPSKPSRVLWDPQTGVGRDLLPCETPGVDDFGEPICVGEGEPARHEVAASVDGSEIVAFGVTESGDLTGDVLALDPESGDVIDADEVNSNSPSFEIFTEQWGFGMDISGHSAIDRQTGERLYTRPFASPVGASPSGGLIAVGHGTTTLVVIDTEVWEEIVTVEGSARIRGLAFDEDEKRIAVGDVESLYVVDLETGVIVQQVRLPGVSDIHWLDDETVLVGTNTGLFGTLSLSTDDFLDRTRLGLRRTFTDQECTIYRIDPCPTLDEMRGG
jgi:WD40 repeat protein